jgi:hypothetical protein
MNKGFKYFLACLLGGLFLTANLSLQAAPNKTEAELIQMLGSDDFKSKNDALDRLAHWYPNSTNAVELIKGILRSNEVIVVTETTYESAQGGKSTKIVKPVPHLWLARAAARSLGNYHVKLSQEELDVVYKLLNSRDEETTMDALKALRGLNNPEAVPKIIPLLEDKNAHVVRDACRTLAVLGDKSTIPYIEPLTKNFESDIRWDALDAIKKLRGKP